jgi:hypothetical protein
MPRAGGPPPRTLLWASADQRPHHPGDFFSASSWLSVKARAHGHPSPLQLYTSVRPPSRRVRAGGATRAHGDPSPFPAIFVIQFLASTFFGTGVAMVRSDGGARGPGEPRHGREGRPSAACSWSPVSPATPPPGSGGAPAVPQPLPLICAPRFLLLGDIKALCRFIRAEVATEAPSSESSSDTGTEEATSESMSAWPPKVSSAPTPGHKGRIWPLCLATRGAPGRTRWVEKHFLVGPSRTSPN